MAHQSQAIVLSRWVPGTLRSKLPIAGTFSRMAKLSFKRAAEELLTSTNIHEFDLGLPED